MTAMSVGKKGWMMNLGETPGRIIGHQQGNKTLPTTNFEEAKAWKLSGSRETQTQAVSTLIQEPTKAPSC